MGMKEGWGSRLLPSALVFVALSGYAQAITTVRIQDTLFNADGSKVKGRLTIEWKGFTASDGTTLATGSVTVKDGLYLWVVSRGMALRNTDGTPTAIAGAQIDITPLITVEKKIVNDAFQDKLTGLPNRQACVVRLEGRTGLGSVAIGAERKDLGHELSI